MLIRKMFESRLSEMLDFLDFWERFYRILMVRKRHCKISEALTNVFALSPNPGGPPFGPLGLGDPGFSRS